MIDFVPQEHLLHLISRLLPEQQVEGAVSALTAGDRTTVLEMLEAAEAGVTARLARCWAYYGSKSVHLWRVPKLKDLGSGPTRSQLSVALGVQVTEGDPVRLEPPAAPEPDRIAWLLVGNGEMRSTVRVTVPRLVQVDSATGEQQVDSYTPVDLLVTFADGLAEGYGGYSYGRRALKAVHRAIFAGVPDDSSRLWSSTWIPPVNFSEGSTDRFTQHHGMALVNVKGPDPAGEFGAVEYDAKVERGAEVPFSNEDRIEEQLRQDNDHRTYNFVFTHGDGYRENVKVRFTLGKVSHLTFVSRTSRDAMKWLIDELVAFLGP